MAYASDGIDSTDRIGRALHTERLADAPDPPSCRRFHMRNLDLDVTGVLLYSDGHFMQCLEGPADRLASVYDRIKSDSLHFGIIDLVREPIQERAFSEWSMAFRVAGALGDAAPEQQDDLLSRKLSSSGEPLSVSRALLAKFWSRGRHAVVPNLIELASAHQGPARAVRRR